MSDFVRLIDESERDGLERLLIASARDDAPSAAARHDAYAMLGLSAPERAPQSQEPSAVHSAESAPHSSAALGGVGAAARGGAATSGVTAGLALWKWLGVLGVASIFASGSVALVSKRAPEESRVAQPVFTTVKGEQSLPATPRATTSIESARSLPEPGGEPAPARLSRAPEAARANERSGRSPRSPSGPSRAAALVPGVDLAAANEAKASAPPGVLDEVASLDAARRVLQTGEPTRALGMLEEHERRFPRGALVPEARVLKISGLLKAGRTAEAQLEGRRFLARDPRSPHAARVRRLLGMP